MVNAYIEDMETIQALEQEDRINGVVGFFAEVVLNGEHGKKQAFKVKSLSDALKKAEAAIKEDDRADVILTLWHVEGGTMREVGVFSRYAEDAVWMHEYRDTKQTRQLIYTCALRPH